MVNFADRMHLDVPMTSDLRVLEAGIGRVDSIGGTALRDAVDFAESYLREHATRDRRILVITDGKDNASVTSPDRIRQHVETESDDRGGLSVNERHVRKELIMLAASWRQVLTDDVPHARPIVSSLLKGRVIFTPLADSQRWQLRGEGSLSGLFAGEFAGRIGVPNGIR